MKENKFTQILVGIILILSSITAFAQTDSAFKPSGKFVGQFFADYFYVEHAAYYAIGNSQYTGVQKDYASFDIRRLFLGYNYDFSTTVTGEILFSYEGNLDGSGNRGVLLKVADIKIKSIYPNADLILGEQFTPSFVLLSEKLWGYRSIEKTLLDKNKIAVPTDAGIGIQGSFDDEKNYGYDLLYADGTGTKPETNRYKKLYGDLWAKFFNKKFMVQVYADLNRSKDLPPVDFTTMKFFVGYQTEPLTIGVEGFIQSETNVIETQDIYGITNYADASPFGISAFLSGQIIKDKLNFFARYDMFNPDRNFDPSAQYVTLPYSAAKEYFFTAGLDWLPAPGVHLMPNLWYSSYHSMISGIKGTDLSDHNIIPRVTFSFRF